jgi:hypothetical protein
MENGVFRKMSIVERNPEPPDMTVRRLKRKLDSWADSLGFDQPYTAPTLRAAPEVTRVDPSGRYVFLGEVVTAACDGDAAHRPPWHFMASTAELASLVKEGKVDGGKLALATNDARVAESWAQLLGTELQRQGLAGADGSAPQLTIKRLAPNTWIVYW